LGGKTANRHGVGIGRITEAEEYATQPTVGARNQEQPSGLTGEPARGGPRPHWRCLLGGESVPLGAAHQVNANGGGAVGGENHFGQLDLRARLRPGFTMKTSIVANQKTFEDVAG
jgi:hypothetical protein